ncbi:PEP-CTERM sorting domain-containing protein [Zoogloeaceae bacterium G21618-S1]|nr:PEP-CTERM sorting domain-containing protein [Zoogloeaceae bacterium G21618-S1]
MKSFAMPRLVGGLLALALSMTVAANAWADVIVQTRNFSVADLDGGVNGVGWHSRQQSSLLQFNLFDATLGTLTGARWVIDSSVRANARSIVTSTALNNVFEGGMLDAHFLSGTDWLLGTGGTGIFSVYQEANDSCIATKLQGCILDLQLHADLMGQIVATDLLAFAGIGSFNQQVATIMEYQNSPFVPWSEDFSKLSMDTAAGYDFASEGGFGTLSLVYEYEASGSTLPPGTVPEPSSALLIGLAGAMLATMRRRGAGARQRARR